MTLAHTLFANTREIEMAFSIGTLLLLPGPTNTLLLASGLKIGFGKSIPLAAAELLGYLLAISSWGIIVHHLGSKDSLGIAVLKFCCGLYLARTAWKFWHEKEKASVNTIRAVSFQRVLLATFLNPKALLFAVGIFPGTTFFVLNDFISSLLIFSTVLVPAGLLWISLGSLFYRGGRTIFMQGWVSKFVSFVLLTFASALIVSPFAAILRH